MEQLAGIEKTSSLTVNLPEKMTSLNDGGFITKHGNEETFKNSNKESRLTRKSEDDKLPTRPKPLMATESFGCNFASDETNGPGTAKVGPFLSRNSSFNSSEVEQSLLSNMNNLNYSNHAYVPQPNTAFYPTSFTPDASVYNMQPMPHVPIEHRFMTPPPANMMPSAPLSIHVPQMSPVSMSPHPPHHPAMYSQMQLHYQWQSMYNNYIYNVYYPYVRKSRTRNWSGVRRYPPGGFRRKLDSFGDEDVETEDEDENTEVESQMEDDILPEEQRLSPKLFSSRHSFAKFSTNGKFALTDNINAEKSQIFYTNQVIPMVDCIKRFPGPLNRDRNLKMAVKTYLNNRINLAQNSQKDKHLIILMKYLIILIEGNGAVSGSSVSQILLDEDEMVDDDDVAVDNDYWPESVVYNCSNFMESESEKTLNKDDSKILNGFAMSGEENKMVEYCCDEMLWGYALRLAALNSDYNVNNFVIDKFDQQHLLLQTSSGYNPLQTFITIKEKKNFSPMFLSQCWENWEQHVAVILSNPSNDLEYDQKCLAVIGDALFAKGLNIAAQICYILAGLQFGLPWETDSRLLLLGTSAKTMSAAVNDFDSIFLSIVFEYAVHLRPSNQNVCFPSLQLFKFLLARQLVEFGLRVEAHGYCEGIVHEIWINPIHFTNNFIKQVYDLSSQLVYSLNSSPSCQCLDKLHNILYPPLPMENECHESILDNMDICDMSVSGAGLQINNITAASTDDRFSGTEEAPDKRFGSSIGSSNCMSMGFGGQRLDDGSRGSGHKSVTRSVSNSTANFGLQSETEPVVSPIDTYEFDFDVNATHNIPKTDQPLTPRSSVTHEPVSPNVFAESSADLRYLSMASRDQNHMFAQNSPSKLDPGTHSAVAFDMPSSALMDTRSTFDPSGFDLHVKNDHQRDEPERAVPKYKVHPYYSGSNTSVHSIGGSHRHENMFRESMGSEMSESMGFNFGGRSRNNSIHERIRRHSERPQSACSDQSVLSLKYTTLIQEADENHFDDRATPTNQPASTSAPASVDKKHTEDKNKKSNHKRTPSWILTGVKNVLGKIINKNQMHLPDDSSTDFYWDEELKKWVDKTKDGKEEELPPPPPTTFSVPNPTNTVTQSTSQSLSTPNSNAVSTSIKPNTDNNSSTLPPVSTNPFAKGRGLSRSKYVDILAKENKVIPTQTMTSPPSAPQASAPGTFLQPPMMFPLVDMTPFPMPDPEEDEMMPQSQQGDNVNQTTPVNTPRPM